MDRYRLFGRARKGANLIEVLVAAVVAGVVLLSLAGFVSATLRSTSGEKDRTFAMQKALQMMEEMNAYKSTGPTDRTIDKMASGLVYELTTQKNVRPYDPLSGNLFINNKYRYVRQISVAAVGGDPYARQVTIRVYLQDPQQSSPTALGKPLATVTNVLRTTFAAVGPRQVIDVYAINVENVPHVFRKDDSSFYYPSAADARLMFENALKNIETQNPAITFRKRYITRLSVGRDPHYRPYINDANPLTGGTRDPLNYVYFYPGKVNTDASSPKYYDHASMKAQMSLGTSGAPGDKTGYVIADQANHPVRHALEINDSGAPILPPGVSYIGDYSELSLRQFLEDMLTNTTGKYRNAIVVNLHGEMFPGLALRPYADPAKDLGDPDAITRERRLVTHPYKISFDQPSESVKLLVHPFFADGRNGPYNTTAFDPGTGPRVPEWENKATYYTWTNPDHYARNAKIIVKDVVDDLAHDALIDPLNITGSPTVNDIKITVVQAERQSNGRNNDVRYARVVEWPPTASPAEKGSRFIHGGPHASEHAPGHHYHPTATFPAQHGSNPQFVGQDLHITLSDMVYDALNFDDAGTGYGLDRSDANNLLYGLQYFPDPYLPFLDVSSGGWRARNTARVMIEFRMNSSAVGKRYQVITQLTKSPTTSSTADGALPDPNDLNDLANSRTWFYVGNHATQWITSKKWYTHVPLTDQFQLTGDPRHNPYHDARKEGLYNPYWDDWQDDDEVYRGVTNKSSDSTTFMPMPALGGYPYANPPTVSLGTRINLEFPNTAEEWLGMKYNGPAYFRLWREALLRNDAVFANLLGEPFRFLGLGGEFKARGYVNDDPTDVQLSRRPWEGDSGNADDRADELTSDNQTVVENFANNWFSKPWLGELYPSYASGTWKNTGNLQADSSVTTSFRRRKIEDTAWSPFTNRSNGNNRRRISNNMGLTAFINGESASDDTLDLEEGGDGDDSTLTTTGTNIASLLRFALEAQVNTRFAYKLTGGPKPPEWTQSPYSGNRTDIEWLNSHIGTPNYYRHEMGGGTYTSNGPILIKQGSTHRALVVANTIKPNAATDVQEWFNIGTATTVASFFDYMREGVGQYNNKAIPRVKIMDPLTGGSVIRGNVPLRWYGKWVKPDGERYSPLFTFNGTRATNMGGPLPIAYYIKYKHPVSGSWFTRGGVATQPGVPTAEAPIVNNQYPAANTATWSTTNATALPAGEYLLRIEAYRMDGSNVLPTHYGYHEIPVTLP